MPRVRGRRPARSKKKMIPGWVVAMKMAMAGKLKLFFLLASEKMEAHHFVAVCVASCFPSVVS